MANPTGPHFDYVNQAWTIDGRYVVCAHPDSPRCNCYGTRHAGELAPLENLPTATECEEPPAPAPLDPQRIAWMESILSNDENSTDYELGLFFIAHAVPEQTAQEYIARRTDYLNTL